MHVLILGTRGIPANHGGFETFAEDLALFLTAKGHSVTVYCQTEPGTPSGEDVWKGVRRILIPAENTPLGTIVFDWKATRHSSREDGVILTLGYNTAIFTVVYRLKGMPHVMNMDGIEWKRPKWSKLQRAWLRLNEWIGAHVADHLVADHPEIEKHLQRHTAPKKITMIPYGADRISSTENDLIGRFGLNSKQYYLLIARPEPENSVVEVVQAFSRDKRGLPLVVLGRYSPDIPYHHRVMESAGPEILFLGAIYERDVVQALRSHTRAYFHGHTVGGTNPSLVESLGTGTAIIAHDNRYNRWVAGDGARYFQSTDDLATLIGTLEAEPDRLIAMEGASRGQHKALFTKETPLELYEQLLQSQVVARTIHRKIPAIRPTEKDSTI